MGMLLCHSCPGTAALPHRYADLSPAYSTVRHAVILRGVVELGLLLLEGWPLVDRSEPPRRGRPPTELLPDLRRLRARERHARGEGGWGSMGGASVLDLVVRLIGPAGSVWYARQRQGDSLSNSTKWALLPAVFAGVMVARSAGAWCPERALLALALRVDADPGNQTRRVLRLARVVARPAEDLVRRSSAPEDVAPGLQPAVEAVSPPDRLELGRQIATPDRPVCGPGLARVVQEVTADLAQNGDARPQCVPVAGERAPAVRARPPTPLVVVVVPLALATDTQERNLDRARVQAGVVAASTRGVCEQHAVLVHVVVRLAGLAAEPRSGSHDGTGTGARSGATACDTRAAALGGSCTTKPSTSQARPLR